MDLLSLPFIILIVKIVISVLPGILAIALLASSEENLRSIRHAFCDRIFGIRNAIELHRFKRFAIIVSTVAILYSLTATWFLLLSQYFT